MSEINNTASIKALSNSQGEKGLNLKQICWKNSILRISAVVFLLIASVFLLVGAFIHPPLQNWLIGWMGGAGLLILTAVASVIVSLNYFYKKQQPDLKTTVDQIDLIHFLDNAVVIEAVTNGIEVLN